MFFNPKATCSRIAKVLAPALFLVLFSGCAYPISQQYREQVRPDLTFPMVLKDPQAYVGSIVIWGGMIVTTLNRPGETEITVLETPLGYEEKPMAAEYTQGRFIVRTLIFLDPAVYREGRRITVAGEVIGQEKKTLGQMEYAYPVLKAKEIHLWSREVVYAYPPDYDWWVGGGYRPYWPGYSYWDY